MVPLSCKSDYFTKTGIDITLNFTVVDGILSVNTTERMISMLKPEEKYAFRKDYCQPHKRIYGVKTRTPNADELILTDGITISTAGLGEVALLAARDFVSYLKTAFGIKATLTAEAAAITAAVCPEQLADPAYMARKTVVSAEGIAIWANDERGIAQAFYALEDRMNDRKAPFLTIGEVEQKPLFSPRMVHSGVEEDVFSDAYLSVCAHHGYDAILAFNRGGSLGADRKPCDFNDICRRAAKYGIDVYAYSYLKNYVHPDEEGAQEKYDEVMGGVFREVPGFKGIVFVGETADFPSKDPHVTALPNNQDEIDGIPTGKPNPGWYPCYDYPQWLTMARDAVRKVKPDADIIFWTYNFSQAPVEARVKFVEEMPGDVSLQVNFNSPWLFRFDNAPSKMRDYTISQTEPSVPFLAEAAVAKRRGIRLYSMVNTAGRTWDFGTAPYEPFPWQWNKLHENILKAHEEFGLCGLMESHHFGFTPSFISKQAQNAYTTNSKTFDEYIGTWAKNLAGEDQEKLLAGMKLVDESIRHYVPSNENQYGPYRVGPAFPFCLCRETHMPTPGARFGYSICFVNAYHDDRTQAAPYALRRLDEMAGCKESARLTKEGAKILRTIKNRSKELDKLIGLVEYMHRCHITALNFKEFTILKEKMMLEANLDKMAKLADKMEALLAKERANTEATIPLVQRDSSLGYEPSMDYIGGEGALRWKLKHMEYVLEHELPAYRRH